MAETKVANTNSVEMLEQQVDALLADIQTSLHDAEAHAAAEEALPAKVKEQAPNIAADADKTVAAEPVAIKTEVPDAAADASAALESEMAAELTRSLDAAETEKIPEAIAAPAAPETAPQSAPSAPLVTAAETADQREVAEAEAALAEEVQKIAEAKQEVEEPKLEAEGEPDEKSLDAAVSAMVADATAAIEPAKTEPAKTETPPAATPAKAAEKSESAVSVEDLDTQLASLTEQMLSEPAPEPAVHAVAGPTPGKAAPVTNPVTAATVLAREGTHKAAAAAAEKTEKAPSMRLGDLSPIVVTVLKPLSMPLEKHPRIVRDTLGWVAMITLFWAGTIWAYLLFFHKPVESEVPEHATHISTGEGGHGEATHGKTAGKKGTKSDEEDTVGHLPAIRTVKQADAQKQPATEDSEPASTHGEH